MPSLQNAVLETLPPRNYFTALYWTGTGTGVWDYTSTNNWNTASDFTGSNVAFQSGDSAIFLQNATVTVNSTITAHDVDTGGNGADVAFEGTGTLNLTNGGDLGHATSEIQIVTYGGANLYITNLDDLYNDGNSTLNGSVVTVTNLVNYGTITWLGGIDTTFTANIENHGTINIASDFDCTLTFDGTITNYAGSINWTSGYFDWGSSPIENVGTLHWNVTDTSLLSYITNSGTIVLDTDIDLSGLTLASGIYELSDGYVASTSDDLTVDGGSLVIDEGAALDWTDGDLTIGSDGNLSNFGTWSISSEGNLNIDTPTDPATNGLHDYSSFAYHVAAEMNTLLSGATAPDFSHPSSSPPPLYDIWEDLESVQIFTQYGAARNTGGWWGEADLTASPIYWRTYDANDPIDPYHDEHNFYGALVTQRDMLSAWHLYIKENPLGPNYPEVLNELLNIGHHVTFMGSDGYLHTSYIAKITQVGNTDIAVVTFADDVDSSVTPMQLLPDDFNGYVLNIPLGSNAADLLPITYTNQDGTLLTRDYNTDLYEDLIHVVSSTDLVREQFTYPGQYPARGGDSGSPLMVLFNGEFVLASCWTSIGAGANYAYYQAGIISAINANASALSVTAYSISTVSLSGFTNYTAIEHV